LNADPGSAGREIWHSALCRDYVKGWTQVGENVATTSAEVLKEGPRA
jgi:hypothetical protein